MVPSFKGNPIDSQISQILFILRFQSSLMDLLCNIPEQPNAPHGHELDQIDDHDYLYAEIEMRILLLISTVDEIDDGMSSSKHLRVRKSSSNYSFSQADQSYFDWTEGENSNSVPTSILNLWRSNGNGTGVFIPPIVENTRKNKPRLTMDEKPERKKNIQGSDKQELMIKR